MLSQGGGVVTATPPELLPEVLQCHNGKVRIAESLALLTTSAHAMLGQAFAPCTCLYHPLPAGMPMDETSTAPEGSAILAQLKGLMFYLWTLILAVPLFVTMLIMSPFVLLFDKHR